MRENPWKVPSWWTWQPLITTGTRRESFSGEYTEFCYNTEILFSPPDANSTKHLPEYTDLGLKPQASFLFHKLVPLSQLSSPGSPSLTHPDSLQTLCLHYELVHLSSQGRALLSFELHLPPPLAHLTHRAIVLGP